MDSKRSTLREAQPTRLSMVECSKSGRPARLSSHTLVGDKTSLSADADARNPFPYLAFVADISAVSCGVTEPHACSSIPAQCGVANPKCRGRRRNAGVTPVTTGIPS